MDMASLRAAEYQLTHKHDDGTWARLEEAPLHHGAVEHDQERAWGMRRLFRCTVCDEAVYIVPSDGDGNPIEPA